MFRPSSKWAILAALVLLATACRGVHGESLESHTLTLNGTSVHIRPAGYVHAPIQIEWDAVTKTLEITPPSDLTVRVSATHSSEPLTLDGGVVNTVTFAWVENKLEWTATNASGHTKQANRPVVNASWREPYLSSFTSTLTSRTARIWVYIDGYRTSFYLTQQFS